jgi:hypothetical protein
MEINMNDDQRRNEKSHSQSLPNCNGEAAQEMSDVVEGVFLVRNPETITNRRSRQAINYTPASLHLSFGALQSLRTGSPPLLSGAKDIRGWQPFRLMQYRNETFLTNFKFTISLDNLCGLIRGGFLPSTWTHKADVLQNDTCIMKKMSAKLYCLQKQLKAQ